ncbi:hypothetical protein PCAR4_780006 [Paraburkholderia caribensis]|nr:hypothetical protein PCAR4_780006 [Paraburkholderia caribensis]
MSGARFEQVVMREETLWEVPRQHMTVCEVAASEGACGCIVFADGSREGLAWQQWRTFFLAEKERAFMSALSVPNVSHATRQLGCGCGIERFKTRNHRHSCVSVASIARLSLRCVTLARSIRSRVTKVPFPLSCLPDWPDIQ